MPEHLKALVVIATLASVVFFAAEKPCMALASPAEFRRWRNLWFGSTIAAFLCHNFWIYVLAASLLTFYLSVQYKNKGALFLLLLFVIPAGDVPIAGFGVVNKLFELNQPRLLALLLLLPSFISAISTEKRSANGTGNVADKLFLSYVLLEILLQLRQTTFTDTVRFGFLTFLDTVLPYFVFSRSLRDMHAFRQTLLCFVLACLVISPIAIFEFGKNWLLYSSLGDVLGLNTAGNYIGRANMLRAIGPAGHPIVLGYTLMVGLGFYLFLMRSIEIVFARRLALLLLIGGLAATLSRGPWLGTALMIVVFASTGRAPLRNLIALGVAGGLALLVLAVIPGGDKILDLLPYIGTVEAGNIEYRNRLFYSALTVFERNLWFGSIDFRQAPEMLEMIQGQGIVDIVNTYVEIALRLGVVGLTLFALFLLSSLLGVWHAMALVKAHNSDEHALGRALLSSMLAILFTISTVSSIFNVSVILWTVGGMCVAYARMVRSPNSVSAQAAQTKSLEPRNLAREYSRARGSPRS